MQECICIEYTRNFKILDLKLHKSQKLVYECIKLIILNNELKNGFYPYRFNKPTKKGTSVNFKLIENENIDECIEQFIKLELISMN